MRKLTLSLLLVVLTSVVGLGWIIGEFYSYVSPTSDRLEQQSDPLTVYRDLGSNLANTLDELQNPAQFSELWGQHSDFSLTLQSLDNFPLPEPLRAEFISGQALVLESDSGVSLNYYLPAKQQIMTLELPPIPAVAENTKLRLSLTLLFYTGVFALIVVWLHPLISRLTALRRAAKCFGDGDLAARVAKSRFSHIADIEHEFNRMAERIQTLVSDNKLLSRAVSHDLRTPLARLRFGIETLSETTDLEQREKYFDRISQDLLEMEQLVNTLLQFARLDESSIQLKMDPLDLASCVEPLLKGFEDEQVSVTCETGTHPLWVRGDVTYLAMLANNLIHNAVRHAKSQVQVILDQQEGHCRLVIEDDGEGIPQAEREQVLKPFVRGSKISDSNGHGMGLAIVSRIAGWHSASLSIDESSALGGARLSVTFPSAER